MEKSVYEFSAALLKNGPHEHSVSLADFRGKSLEYFTTHADLVKRQSDRKAAQKAAAAAKTVKNDAEWTGDDFVKQSDALSR